jgi:hypothetical protein
MRPRSTVPNSVLLYIALAKFFFYVLKRDIAVVTLPTVAEFLMLCNADSISMFSLKMAMFWDAVPCCLVNTDRRFRRSYTFIIRAMSE